MSSSSLIARWVSKIVASESDMVKGPFIYYRELSYFNLLFLLVLQMRLSVPCSQAQRIAGFILCAQDKVESLCKHYKDAHLWWGMASFFTCAPQELSGPAALARCCACAVCTRGRTVLAPVFEFGHGLGLDCGLLVTLRTPLCRLHP